MKSSLRVLIAATLACLMIGLLAYSADAHEQTSSVTITGTSTNAVQLAEPISGSTHVATTFADLNIDFPAQLVYDPIFLGSEQVATMFADAVIVNPGLVFEAIQSQFVIPTSGRSHPGQFSAKTFEDGQLLVLEQRTGVTVNDAVMRELDVFFVRSPELSRIVGWVDITAPPNAIIDGVMTSQIRKDGELFTKPVLLLPRKE